MKCRKKEAYLTLRGKLFITKAFEAANLSVCILLQAEKFFQCQLSKEYLHFTGGKQNSLVRCQSVKYFFCFLESTG